MYGDLRFFSVVVENATFLGCYAMYGPSGMKVEVIPEDDESIFLQKTNKSPNYMASQHRTRQPESSIQQKSQMSIVNLSV